MSRASSYPGTKMSGITPTSYQSAIGTDTGAESESFGYMALASNWSTADVWYTRNERTTCSQQHKINMCVRARARVESSVEQRGAATIDPGQAFSDTFIPQVPHSRRLRTQRSTFKGWKESLSVVSLLLTGVFEPLRLSHTTGLYCHTNRN